MAFNFNPGQTAFDNLTAIQQKEILAKQAQGSRVPMSHYINAGTQPRGLTEQEKIAGAQANKDSRTQQQMADSIESSRERAAAPMPVNPNNLAPNRSDYVTSLIENPETSVQDQLYEGAGLSPASMHAMMQQGILPVEGGVRYDDAATLASPRGNVADFFTRAPSDLINNGFVPISKDGSGTGTQRQITNEYELDEKKVPVYQGPRGTYKELTEAEATSQIELLQGQAQTLGKYLGMAQDSEDQTFRRALSEEFGEQAQNPETGALSDELAGNLLLAYFSAMEQSSYADYSAKEKRNHAAYLKEYGKLHPDLWEKRDGRDARTPQFAVLEDGIGKALEENSGIKLGQKHNRDIIGQGVMRAMAATDQGGMAGIGVEFRGPGGIPINGDTTGAYPVYYMTQDTIVKRDQLSATKGIRSLLNPGARNNVRLTKRLAERDIEQELYGPRQSGVDRVRAEAMNIQESSAMRIDQGMLRVLNRTFHANEELNEFWQGSSMKVKETSYNIVNQQDAYINQNGTDGVFYSDQKYRSSGRKGDENLMMADFKIVRALAISAKAGDNTFIKFGDNKVDKNGRGRTDNAFKVGVMFLLGLDEKVEKETIKAFNQEFSDPASSGRMFASALEELSKKDTTDERVNELIGQYFSGSSLTDFRDTYMKEGSDSIQALRGIAKYYAAKDKGSNGFTTTLIGEIDAAQSGQTIQAYQIGDFLGAMRGGTITSRYVDDNQQMYDNLTDRSSKGVLNSVDKLYVETVANVKNTVRSQMMGRFPEGSNKSLIAAAFFGDKDNSLENMFQNRFAKTGVQGASYGQMKDGAIQAIREDMIEWFQDLNSEEIYHRTLALKQALQLDADVQLSKILEDSGDLVMLLHELATDYYQGMNKASKGKLEVYSRDMRNAFKAMTSMSAFGVGLGWDLEEPMMVYKTPKDVNNVYGGDWVDGMRTTMIDKVVPGEWMQADFAGIDEATGQEFSSVVPLTYNTRASAVDIGAEKLKQTWQEDQEKFLNNSNSDAITRFPVISIHGLDDLIMSIAISEMNKSLLKKGGKGLEYIMSVWDAGRVPVLLRDEFAQHYNKAFEIVMKKNNFFTIMHASMETYLKKAQANRALVEAKGPAAVKNLEELADSVAKMKLTMERYLGKGLNYKGDTIKTGGGTSAFAGNTEAIMQMDSGLMQPWEQGFGDYTGTTPTETPTGNTLLTPAEAAEKRRVRMLAAKSGRGSVGRKNVFGQS